MDSATFISLKYLFPFGNNLSYVRNRARIRDTQIGIHCVSHPNKEISTDLPEKAAETTGEIL